MTRVPSPPGRPADPPTSFLVPSNPFDSLQGPLPNCLSALKHLSPFSAAAAAAYSLLLNYLQLRRQSACMEPTTATKHSTNLPPGFRFHPTDEELIVYYLRNQAKSKPCPVSIIPEVDIYKCEPWELPDKAVGEKEWYFFSPRERKYPNGARPNRATVSGYWKATGTDKAIHRSSGSSSEPVVVGVKKALVFYMGRPPKGLKTDWIMHEYRLIDSISTSRSKKIYGSMRPAHAVQLDEWVLCRIYKKRHAATVTEASQDGACCTPLSPAPAPAPAVTPAASDQDDGSSQKLRVIPKPYSLSHLLEFDRMSLLLGDRAYDWLYGFEMDGSISSMDRCSIPAAAAAFQSSVESTHHRIFNFKPNSEALPATQ
ncbi:hypothetical protein ACLOJK_022311 [Asimina triloba]